jgi:hypothetical protein
VLKRAASERSSVRRYHHALEVLQKHPEDSEARPTAVDSPTTPIMPTKPTTPATRLSSGIPEPPPSIRILGRSPEADQALRREYLEAQAEEARKRFVSSLNREQAGRDYHYQAQANLTQEVPDAEYKPKYLAGTGLQNGHTDQSELEHQDETVCQNGHGHQEEPTRQNGHKPEMFIFDDESLPDTLSLESSRGNNKTLRNPSFSSGQKKTIAILVSIVVVLGLVLALISFGGSTKPKSVSVARNQTPTSRQRVTAQSTPRTKGHTKSNGSSPTSKPTKTTSGKSKPTKQATKKNSASNPNPYNQSNTSGSIRPTSYSMFTGTYPAPPGNYTVTLSPGEKCWVMAKSLTTGNVLWTGMTYPGRPQAISASGSITIELGAAFQMVVTIAGKSLSLPANYSSPFTITLNPI